METDLDFSSVPPEFAATVDDLWRQYQQAVLKAGIPFALDERLASSLPRVWSASSYVANQCIRSPSLLADLIASNDLFSPLRRGSYLNELGSLLEVAEDQEELQRILRRFRHREMVRIAWRDISGWDAVEDVLCDLSLLAEACIHASLEWLFQRACQRYGVPVASDGKPQLPVILGMGKLGGWELNFSSDIDLIFCFEQDGQLEDRRGTSYQEFYLRLCRDLVKVIGSQTEDGFVFRVDTRLRPFGDSGPLVLSFDAMEIYYQSQARAWERYAMIKARPIAGDPESGQRLMEILQPFVYRRYLDYRALGALRELKLKIIEELKRRDRMDDIKLGPGGIREIEFIAQVFQLIHGGRQPGLRERRLLPVLARLGSLGLMPRHESDRLIDGYRFLRRVENRLQQADDRQTQKLPDSESERLRLAIAMDYPDWESFSRDLDQVRKAVQETFDQVFAVSETPVEQSPASKIWRGVETPQALIAELEQLGFADGKKILEKLAGCKRSRPVRYLTPSAEAELDRLMPALIESVTKTPDPDQALQRMLDLIESIASRSVYLTLLAENTAAREHLVKLVAASPWIARQLANYPALLDELLDPRTLYAPLNRSQLEQELQKRLDAVDPNDEEGLLNALRHFKQGQLLRVAAADLVGAIPTNVVSDYLTEIAEVVLGQVLNLAWCDVTKKYGVPGGKGADRPHDFAIIGYGKLGGIELGYGSDLDLVFLYQGDSNAETTGPRRIPASQFYIRLGQKIIHILTIPMLAGVLYEIDMRLRPSGKAGLLVSQLLAFARYQREEAWTWEHQALVRARPVAGDTELAERFVHVRLEILCKPRDLGKLRREVIEMRNKMRSHLDRSGEDRFDLKQGVGGMVDIEFIVQFGSLAFANRCPEEFRWTDNLRLLDALDKVGWLTVETAEFLQRTYLAYRARGHTLALQEQPALVPVSEFSEERRQVQRLWQQLIETEQENIEDADT